MSVTVLVICPLCRGASAYPDNPPCPDVCHSQGHIAVDRTADGTVPEGFTEWLPRELPTLPNIPRCC